MTAITQALSTALLDFVWQGLLAAFLLWSALFALKNRSARARYAASCVALAVMAALPVVTASLVYTAPALVGHTSWPARVPLGPPAAMPGPAVSSFVWAGGLAGALGATHMVVRRAAVLAPPGVGLPPNIRSPPPIEGG
jgi:hypothetical protein